MDAEKQAIAEANALDNCDCRHRRRTASETVQSRVGVTCGLLLALVIWLIFLPVPTPKCLMSKQSSTQQSTQSSRQPLQNRGLRTPPIALASEQKKLSGPSTSLLRDFQLYKPVSQPESAHIGDVLLMRHHFAHSYGRPFVGEYTPPSYSFNWVSINLTVTSAGRQFDRLALMWLGDTEVFRTSTAEPTTDGIIYTYVKDMSAYLSLWQKPQKLIFDLGNLVDSTYTGAYNVTLTASFSNNTTSPVVAADIFPISAKLSASNSSSSFSLPSQSAVVSQAIPKNATRAVVSISACGQSLEEQWFTSLFPEDVNTFDSSLGQMTSYSPFREVQLLIDGHLAGVVWPFPIIFTGGIVPGLWRPLVGTDTFDLREPEIDITPFIPMLSDGKDHQFEIKVRGLNDPKNGTTSLSDTISSYWVVSGKIFVYYDGPQFSYYDNSPPVIHNRAPIYATRNLVTDPKTGANLTVTNNITMSRHLSVSSPYWRWEQNLSFFNNDKATHTGFQHTDQHSSGSSSSTMNNGTTISRTNFSYPLLLDTLSYESNNTIILSANITRSLIFSHSDIDNRLSTYTLVSGPADMSTTQKGSATYYAVNNQVRESSGETQGTFAETSNGSPYHKKVYAVNGTVVSEN